VFHVYVVVAVAVVVVKRRIGKKLSCSFCFTTQLVFLVNKFISLTSQGVVCCKTDKRMDFQTAFHFY
jgi:hypothetical protein